MNLYAPLTKHVIKQDIWTPLAGYISGLSALAVRALFPQGTNAPFRKARVPVNATRAKSVSQATAAGVNLQERLSIPQPAYVGIQVKDQMLSIAEASRGNTTTHTHALLSSNVTNEILYWLKQVAQQKHQQYIAAMVQDAGQHKDLRSALWLQEDIVPYIIERQPVSHAANVEDLVQEVVSRFDESNIASIQLNASHEVQVAELVTLDDYCKTASQEDFAQLLDLARALQGKKLVFINATPRGGGVALMRHALVRLLRLLDVDAHWYVLIPRKEAFDITKSKFHNVLQAVARQDTELTETDKLLYEDWMKENAEALQGVFQQADMVVIDDPQPAGLIPYIKQANPDAKIIYRSHIQIVGSLASLPGTPQHATWQFLWDKIQHADYLISHPMKMFIPDNVPAEKVFYMPATTDPLDGLNKPLTEEQMSTYLKLFNALLLEDGQKPLDEQRPYIVQIARFDPAKGIPDVLDAYRKVRRMLEEQQRVIPQFIIAGNGSIDDPDGVPIYNGIKEILRSENYASCADDVKVMRLPHCDQILNTLLRKSAVVLQLSTKEGFEVKVTEALMKGKPVIAYNVGGIPLQIQHGIDGYLVEVGNTTQVAKHLYDLLTDADKYQQVSQAAFAHAGKDYLTITNAICWLYLASQLLKGEKMQGYCQWVKALADRQFSGRAHTHEVGIVQVDGASPPNAQQLADEGAEHDWLTVSDKADLVRTPFRATSI
jgi:glycosyltransferase involved in cell wall biosynthesis